ncbi:MAG: type II toxin-antitoxin system HipA family toxin, partial [Comamonadaceae bacterium]
MTKIKKAASYRHVDVVDVYLWGRRIGAVALDPTYGFYVFRYTPEVRATGIEPAPLQMPTS